MCACDQSVEVLVEVLVGGGGEVLVHKPTHQILIYIYITFSNLADALIQRDLQ